MANGGHNPSQSGTQSLGVVDPGNFDAVTAGSAMQFGFTQPVEGFALTIITPEEPGGALFDDDVRLVVPGEATASLLLAGGSITYRVFDPGTGVVLSNTSWGF